MMTLQLKDILVGKDDYTISLVKLTGEAIADVQGYLACDYGGVAFKLTHIVLANGTKIDVEGEHDFPYLISDDAEINLNVETLEALEGQEAQS